MVIAIELLPIMVLPQQRGAALDSRIKNGLIGLAVADQNPDPRLAPAIRQSAGLGTFRLGVGPRIGGIEDSQM